MSILQEYNEVPQVGNIVVYDRSFYVVLGFLQDLSFVVHKLCTCDMVIKTDGSYALQHEDIQKDYVKKVCLEDMQTTLGIQDVLTITSTVLASYFVNSRILRIDNFNMNNEAIKTWYLSSLLGDTKLYKCAFDYEVLFRELQQSQDKYKNKTIQNALITISEKELEIGHIYRDISSSEHVIYLGKNKVVSLSKSAYQIALRRYEHERYHAFVVFTTSTFLREMYQNNFEDMDITRLCKDTDMRIRLSNDQTTAYMYNLVRAKMESQGLQIESLELVE